MRRFGFLLFCLLVFVFCALAGQASATPIKAADEDCAQLILPCVDGVDYIVFIGSKLTINPDYDGPGQNNPSSYDFWRCPTTEYVGSLTPDQCTLIGNAGNGYIVKESDLGLQIIATRGCKAGTFELADYVPYGPSLCIGDRAEQIPTSPIAPTKPVVKRAWVFLPIPVTVPAAYRFAPDDTSREYQDIYYYLKIDGKVRNSCHDKVRDPGVFLGCPTSNSNFVASPKMVGKKVVIQACSVGREVDDAPDPYFLESRHCTSSDPVKIRKVKLLGGGGFEPPKGWQENLDPGVTLSLTGPMQATADMNYSGISVALVSEQSRQTKVTVTLPANEAKRYGLKKADVVIDSWTAAVGASPVVHQVKPAAQVSRRLRKAVTNGRRYRPAEIPVRISVETP